LCASARERQQRERLDNVRVIMETGQLHCFLAMFEWLTSDALHGQKMETVYMGVIHNSLKTKVHPLSCSTSVPSSLLFYFSSLILGVERV
jgi:hypothetical protein